MPRVLIAEDETAIADAVLYALRSEGIDADHCLLARDVAPRVRAGGVDVVVLDVGLPDASGFDVCRELRGFSDVPVIFLTARNDEIDRVLGLELGADDYVTKPFSPRELVARVRARLRRAGAVPVASPASADPWVMRGAFAIDREGHRIRYRQQLLDLTRYEYAVLDALLQRRVAPVTCLRRTAELPAALERLQPALLLLDLNFGPGRTDGSQGLRLQHAQGARQAVDIQPAIGDLVTGIGRGAEHPAHREQLLGDQFLGARREDLRTAIHHAIRFGTHAKSPILYPLHNPRPRPRRVKAVLDFIARSGTRIGIKAYP